MKILTSKADLTRHMRSHTGQKPFECEICGLGFSTKGALKRHEYTHEKEKKFKCDKCPDDRFFRNPAQLQKHMVLHGEKRYKCFKCEKMFHKSCSLKDHERIHINVKPFGCQFCDKRFITSGHLKEHTRKQNQNSRLSAQVQIRHHSQNYVGQG